MKDWNLYTRIQTPYKNRNKKEHLLADWQGLLVPALDADVMLLLHALPRSFELPL